MAKKDPYKTLKVKKTATKEEIKKVFRTRAKKEHPDKGGNPASFAELSSAYSLLMDDNRRASYDTTGEDVQGEDVVRNRAFNLVGSLFVSFVSQLGANWKNKQVKMELLNHLGNAKQEVTIQIIKAEKDLEFWKAVKEDVTCEDKESDPIGDAISEKLKEFGRAKVMADLEIKVITAAIGMVKKYNFKKPLANQFIPLRGEKAYVTASYAF